MQVSIRRTSHLICGRVRCVANIDHVIVGISYMLLETKEATRHIFAGFVVSNPLCVSSSGQFSVMVHVHVDSIVVCVWLSARLSVCVRLGVRKDSFGTKRAR